jgi:hypothetical protein
MGVRTSEADDLVAIFPCCISTQRAPFPHEKNLRKPVAFSAIESMLRINGREIFQQERVDKGYRENRQRISRSVQ